MSKHEIDIMWQKAMCQSIEDGEMFTRYHFAKLVAERALADSMQEVQRLGQEIEQEPVAWAHYDTFKNLGFLTRARFTATLATKKTDACCIALYTHPINQKEFK
jgi:hypothetical protein